MSILDRLLHAWDGAVFVYLHPDLRAQELQLEVDRYDFRTRTKDRLLRGRPFTCAIFHWIPPGAYTVRCKPAQLEAIVTVEAGVLSQVDWRGAFAGWRRVISQSRRRRHVRKQRG
jgi:hypothetical protein